MGKLEFGMTTTRAFLALSLALTLAGCASMSESQCRVADWYRVGLADGGSGTEHNRLADYAEDCGKIGIRPDTTAYRQGWDQGIVAYCTPYNGWLAGVDGQHAKAAVCQGQAGYEGFAQSHRAGLLVHKTQSRMASNDSELRRLQRQLEDATKDEDKRRIRNQMRNLDREQDLLRNTLRYQMTFAP